MASLHELNRPTTLEEVVGQDEAVKRIRKTVARSWGGRAWCITGASGTGKTTLARIIAAMGAEEWHIEELDSQWLTPARLQQCERDMGSMGMGTKRGKCYIVNEMHGLSPKAVMQLLTTLDPLPNHVCFVFTTTLKGASLFEQEQVDSHALMSRCEQIVLENGPETRLAFAQRAREIAVREGLDGLPLEAYNAAVDAANGNMRALLSKVESGVMADDYREAQRRDMQAEYDRLAKTPCPDASARAKATARMAVLQGQLAAA